jgi:hypothetical protein
MIVNVPSTSNVIEYSLIVQLAVIVSQFNGIVSGISLSQCIVYHSFVHEGYSIVTRDSYAHV